MKKTIAHLHAVESDNITTSNVVSFYDHYTKKAEIELLYLRSLIEQNQPALAKLRLRYLYYENLRLLNEVMRQHLNSQEAMKAEYSVLTVRILQHMPMFFQISWIKQMLIRFPEQSWLADLLKENSSETA